MNGARIVAAHGLSALGAGDEAYGVGPLGARAAVAITDDGAGRAEGLLRPRSGRVGPLALLVAGERDRATALLLAALRGCLDQLDETRPRWRAERVGLVVGSSSGAMASAQSFFAKLDAREQMTRDEARRATYFAPIEEALAELGVAWAPVVQVLGACASSTIAMGLGLRWLQLGRCDVVIAAGYDALSSFVTSGFEALSATTATVPRPFRRLRDGMALGEGAAAVALVSAGVAPREAARQAGVAPRQAACDRGHLLGFAASTDAVHLTAPDRTGRGLAHAARAALAEAGVAPEHVDLVSAHATATAFNDVAEARALALALGGRAPHAVHPLKAQIGHTLGAAGLLETMAIVEAMRRAMAPAAAGDGEIDPACAVPLLDTNSPLSSRFALKLSSAFGGANAALVLGAPPTVLGGAPAAVLAPGHGPARRSGPFDVHLGRHVWLRAADAAVVGELLARQHPHPHRPDALARLVVAAVQALGVQRSERRAARGLILGHTTATLEQNHAYELRRRTRGARLVEPRRFPATSPNAAAGECAIVFGLEGPTFAVGATLHGGLEALAVARDLVAAGDAESMLVVCAHLAGSATRSLLALAEAPAMDQGVCAAYLHNARGEDGVRLPPDLPVALEPRDPSGWSGLAGPAELAAYLGALQRPVL